jgi:hypothetical protein
VGALEALTDHAPAIRSKILAGVPAQQIVAEMEPAALSLLDYVAGLLLPPPFGTVFGIVVWAIQHSRPETQDEFNARADRMSEDHG